jgi:hypothetical protein
VAGVCECGNEPSGSIKCGKLPYILESNPHFFYSFRGLKIRCGLDSRSRAGFWKND